MEYIATIFQVVGDFLIASKENPAAAIFAVAILISILGYLLFKADKSHYRAMVFFVVVLMGTFIMFVNYEASGRPSAPKTPEPSAPGADRQVPVDPTQVPSSSAPSPSEATSNPQVDGNVDLATAAPTSAPPKPKPARILSAPDSRLILPDFYGVQAWLGMSFQDFQYITLEKSKYRKQVTFYSIGPFELNRDLSVTSFVEGGKEEAWLATREFAFYDSKLLLIRATYRCNNHEDCFSLCEARARKQESAFSLDGARPDWSSFEVKDFDQEEYSPSYEVREALQVDENYSSYAEQRLLYVYIQPEFDTGPGPVTCLGETNIIHHDLLSN